MTQNLWLQLLRPSTESSISRRPLSTYYEDVTEEEEGETGEAGDKKPAKKSKKTEKKRELVFDESLGQVIARKKRKPGRGGGWEEFTDY